MAPFTSGRSVHTDSSATGAKGPVSSGPCMSPNGAKSSRPKAARSGAFIEGSPRSGSGHRPPRLSDAEAAGHESEVGEARIAGRVQPGDVVVTVRRSEVQRHWPGE